MVQKQLHYLLCYINAHENVDYVETNFSRRLLVNTLDDSAQCLHKQIK